MISVFKNVGERSAAKNYHLVSLLSVISKVFEKLVNNEIANHLEAILCQRGTIFSNFITHLLRF